MKSEEQPKTNLGLNRLSVWLFIYAFAYAFFHILPAFLNYEIKNRLMVADVFDLLTPFVLLSLIWQIYRITAFNTVQDASSSGTLIKILLFMGGIGFVEGHGMHLSANAIARHLTHLQNSSLFALDYLFDEILGHIFWDGGILLLSLGIILMGFRLKQKQEVHSGFSVIIPASLLYGFTYFVNAVEGQTVIFTFPFAIGIPAGIRWFSHRKGLSIRKNPILFLFMCAYLIATGFFLLWWFWQKGFPQFSELGWI